MSSCNYKIKNHFTVHYSLWFSILICISFEPMEICCKIHFKPLTFQQIPTTTETPIVAPPHEVQPANVTSNQRDITIGSCVWTIDRTCPDNDLLFYLFTRRNPSDPQILYITDTLQKSNLSSSNFNHKYPSKIIIHGYNWVTDKHPLNLMKDEYLIKDDYNIFYVDWSKLSLSPCYMSAVHNTNLVGKCTAQLVERIADSGTTDIHVIGFSLGAHVANYIARNLKSFMLPRITGLDPAMPLFITASNDDKLDSSDAVYVDIIHTNAMVQGKLERCGHADFYMNGGIMQPGCFDSDLNPFSCSHQRATAYYMESIRTTKGFWGWHCSSYISYMFGMCPPTNYLTEAGENSKSHAKGMFLIETNEAAPYAAGKWTDITISKLRPPNSGQPIMILTPPAQNADPLMHIIDQWAKLDNNIRYYPESESQNLYWNYLSQNQYPSYHVKHNLQTTRTPVNQQIDWNEYRRNLSIGYIDSSIFQVPTIG